ncbi:MAG: lysylphosphatidylglycerol synthase transmembrane domain-containing protein [Ignavibacteriales bacterium]
MKKKSVTVIISIIITIISFYILFSIVDIKKLIISMKNINFEYFFIGVIFYLVTYIFRSLRFYVYLKEKKIKYLSILFITFLHQFYYRIMPIKTGEISFIYILKKNNNVSIGESGVILLAIRVLEVIALGIIFLVSSIFISNKEITLENICVSIIVIAIFILFLLFLPRIISIISNIAISLNKKNDNQILIKISNILNIMEDKFHEVVASKVKLIEVLFLSLGLWLTLYFSMFFWIKALNIDFSFSKTIVGSLLAVLTTILPVTGIGGFGTTEAGWAVGLTILGMSNKDAISSGIANNLFSFIIICVLGLIGHFLFFKADKMNQQ